MRRIMITASAGLALVAATSAIAQRSGGGMSGAAIETVLKEPGRPSAAKSLDDARKPAQVLAFLGLRRGMIAADFITGTGYWAEILSRAVGPGGSVVAYQPEQFYNDPAGKFALDALQARNPNLALIRYPFEALAPGDRSFDFAIINDSYHDLYWQSERFKIPRTEPAAFVKALFAMMKPGGVVGVIDHAANPGGDTREIVDKLHRIDPATVKADFEAAGFRLAATSDLLAQPQDDHGKLIFDPAVRGKTDRFLFKFVKPR
jgi:predicted methyltransferase